MVLRPIVYLDSSDYSALSDPRKRSTQTESLKAELLAISASGDAIFAYSGAHLSEMAPLEAPHSGAAEARAELLSKLCGLNAFVSVDRLIRFELAGAIGAATEEGTQLLSATGDWFPQMDGLMPSLQWSDHKETVNQTLKEHGVSRAQRRKQTRRLFKNGVPTAETLAILASQDATVSRQEVIDKYPMRSEDADVLRRFVLRQATAAEGDAAFLNSLRDPRWMMSWFQDHHGQLGAVGDYLRKPSRDMIGLIRAAATALAGIRANFGNTAATSIAEALGRDREDQLLMSVANKIAASQFPDLRKEPIEDPRLIGESCPGLSVAVRSLFSVLRDAVAERARAPKDSDFVDVAHAMYAPRVSLFRTDRYMAPHVAKHLPRGSAVVVPRLDGLLSELRKMLA